MDHKLRIVTSIPVTELWTNDGPMQAIRERDLFEPEIRELLRSSRVRFVVADVGHGLEWIAADQTFAFWKDEVVPRLMTLPFNQDEVHDHAYVASAWKVADPTEIVLLERYH